MPEEKLTDHKKPIRLERLGQPVFRGDPLSSSFFRLSRGIKENSVQAQHLDSCHFGKMFHARTGRSVILPICLSMGGRHLENDNLEKS